MNAVATSLLEFLRKAPQFVIPIYQRTYSWGEPECRQLWDDIVRTGRDSKVPAHFVGSIVYVQEGLYSITFRVPQLADPGRHAIPLLAEDSKGNSGRNLADLNVHYKRPAYRGSILSPSSRKALDQVSATRAVGGNRIRPLSSGGDAMAASALIREALLG